MLNGIQAIRSLILADAAAAALIGTRAYALERPQSSSLPAVVIHEITGTRTQTHGGLTEHAEGVLQVDCIAVGYSEAKALAERVIRSCAGFRGRIDGLDVLGVFLQQERDHRREVTTAGDAVAMVQIDLLVHVTEG